MNPTKKFRHIPEEGEPDEPAMPVPQWIWLQEEAKRQAVADLVAAAERNSDPRAAIKKVAAALGIDWRRYFSGAIS